MWTFQLFTQSETHWLKSEEADGIEGALFVVYDNETVTVNPANEDQYPVNASIWLVL